MPHGTSKRAKRNTEQRVNHPEQTTRSGDVTTHTALSQTADVEHREVKECILGFVLVCMEEVPGGLNVEETSSLPRKRRLISGSMEGYMPSLN